MQNWKTTVNGILTFLIATFGALLAFQIPNAMLNPEQSRVYLYFTVGAQLLVSLCRVWIGLIQNDAPPTLPQSNTPTGGTSRMLLALLLIPTLTFGVMPTTSCSVNQATVAALMNTVGVAASGIAALEGDASLVTKIKTDTAAAAQAVANWKKGSDVQMAIEALNLVEDDLNLVPMVGPYVAFIDLGIGAVEEVIILIDPSAAPSTNAMYKARVNPKTGVQHRSVARLKISHWQFRSPRAEFAKKWNKLAEQNPKLGVPTIQ